MIKRIIGYLAVLILTIYLFFMYNDTVISGLLIFVIMYPLLSFWFLMIQRGKVGTDMTRIPSMGEEGKTIKAGITVKNQSAWNMRYEAVILVGNKIEEKKKQKREALLMAAFSLFTSKGINETSISDIASKANMAKGTFYLYFKDKYDIRDKLITEQARQLFDNATIELMEEELPTLEKKVLFIAARVIDKLQENKILMRFISKNLSWGVFHDMLVTGGDEMEGLSFYDAYYKLLEESGRKFRNPDLMLFMIVELINSTCHNVILYEEPVTMDELKPELNALICYILHRQEI